MVTLTDKAAGKVKELLNGQADSRGRAARGRPRRRLLRLPVRARLRRAARGRPDLRAQEIRLLIDSESLPFVDGSEVDYVEGLQGAGFAVNNPNVVAACGCGQSFRTA